MQRPSRHSSAMRSMHKQLPLALNEPASLAELLQRARAIEGRTIGELARELGFVLPDHPRQQKGLAGSLMERALGASAGNLDLPDFPRLGVELKTIPLDASGHVRESTFVCTIDLGRIAEEEWPASRVWRKLQCVLWIPVEAAATGPLAQRHVGTPLLWQPDEEEAALLAADWLLLTGKLALGAQQPLDARLGQVLQVRPKAAHSRIRTLSYDEQGSIYAAPPCGFYLRARFTEQVLWRLSQPG